MTERSAWWKGAVIYQIYPRSFMDANGDGIGDLRGIRSRLDYVAALGVDAIWISPIFTSPMHDFGYDISDYRGVDPIFGDLADFSRLLDTAHELGLKVIIDQVLSHSSDQHPWFQESRQNRTNPKADWYVWADPKPDGSPPNNWLSIFGGGAWTWDSQRMQYYLHNFLDSQPDLNFHHPQVRQAQLDNLRFWLELGVDGVRLDVVNFYFHSAGLEDNPPLSPGARTTCGVSADNPYAMQRHVHDICQPENEEFLKDVRALLDEYPATTSVGEISSDNAIEVMARYTSGNDKLHMAYTFDLLSKRHSVEFVRTVIERVEAQVGDGWPCWAIANHDVMRYPSRWGTGEDPRAYPRVALAMLLSLRGSVSLYQGDELGLPEADVPFERIQDPYGLPFWPVYKGRDGCRTPMVWEAKAGGGFGSSQSWLPIDPAHLPLAVAAQEADPDSLLHGVRKLLRWRAGQPALLIGDLELLDHAGQLLCWIRQSPQQRLLVALNMGETAQSVSYRGAIERVHDEPGFSAEVGAEYLMLPPYQALFAEVSAGFALADNPSPGPTP